MKTRAITPYTAFFHITILSTLFLAGCNNSPEAKVLSKNAIRVDSSDSAVGVAMRSVYEEMRLKHYMNEKGEVVFPDGTSTDRSINEKATRSGSFLHHQISFETPAGEPISINYYREDGQNGIIVWEYRAGDPQEVSQHLQIALGKSGVALR